MSGVHLCRSPYAVVEALMSVTTNGRTTWAIWDHTHQSNHTEAFCVDVYFCPWCGVKLPTDPKE